MGRQPMSKGELVVQLCCLGDGGVGKTAWTIQLTNNHFVTNYDPTIEDSYQKQMSIDDKSYLLEILDTAGQDDFAALRDQWIRESEGFLILYDITDVNTFKQVDTFIKSINFIHPKGIPTILVGNKVDLEDSRQVQTSEGEKKAKEHGFLFIEGSAKTNTNVIQSFENLVRERNRAFGYDKPTGTTKTGEKKKSLCHIL